MPKRSCPRLSCIPKALHVGPMKGQSTLNVPLLHEELEALYLADVRGLYHEACAEAMNVSRPTFAKLLKNARRKCASMFLQGHSLYVNLKSAKPRLIFPSDDCKTMSDKFQSARYFVPLIWDEIDVIIEDAIENPIYKELINSGIEPLSDLQAKGLGAGRLIPPLLQNASIVCALEIGDGMRRNLEGMGLSIQTFPESTKGKTFSEIVMNLI